MKTVGSRAEVFHGNAKRTSGRLVKADLMKNKAGRIVSIQKHMAGKEALKYLHAKGYIAVKGKFGSARKESLPVPEVVVEDSNARVDNTTDVTGAVPATTSVGPAA